MIPTEPKQTEPIVVKDDDWRFAAVAFETALCDVEFIGYDDVLTVDMFRYPVSL